MNFYSQHLSRILERFCRKLRDFFFNPFVAQMNDGLLVHVIEAHLNLRSKMFFCIRLGGAKVRTEVLLSEIVSVIVGLGAMLASALVQESTLLFHEISQDDTALLNNQRHVRNPSLKVAGVLDNGFSGVRPEFIKIA